MKFLAAVILSILITDIVFEMLINIFKRGNEKRKKKLITFSAKSEIPENVRKT